MQRNTLFNSITAWLTINGQLTKTILYCFDAIFKSQNASNDLIQNFLRLRP